MRKRVKKICYNCLLWSLIVIVLISLFFYLIDSGEEEIIVDSTCEGISDTSMKADCYTRMAKESGNIEYCENYPYYFDECLDFADQSIEAEIDDLEEICEANTDSSRKEDCYEYIEENY